MIKCAYGRLDLGHFQEGKLQMEVEPWVPCPLEGRWSLQRSGWSLEDTVQGATGFLQVKRLTDWIKQDWQNISGSSKDDSITNPTWIAYFLLVMLDERDHTSRSRYIYVYTIRTVFRSWIPDERDHGRYKSKSIHLCLHLFNIRSEQCSGHEYRISVKLGRECCLQRDEVCSWYVQMLSLVKKK